MHMAKHMLLLPISFPYHKGILTSLGFIDETCPECKAIPCRFVWSEPLCRPANTNPDMIQFTASYIRFVRAWYPHVASLFLGFAILGSVSVVVRFRKLIPVLLLFGVLLAAHSTATLDGRYVIPLYGPYAILITIGIRAAIGHIKKMVPGQK
jgi:hypothetical protein